MPSRRLLIVVFSFIAFSLLIPTVTFIFKDQIKQRLLGNVTNAPTASVLPKLTSTVNRKTGRGEFIIAPSSPTPVSPEPLRKQVIVEGSYYKDLQKIEAQATTNSSSSPVSPAFLLSSLPKTMEGKILIQLEMVVKGKTLYATVLPFASAGGQEVLPFQAVLPYYYKNFSLRFSDTSDKTLLLKDISL